MALLRDWRPSELDGRVPADRRITRVVAGGLDPRITPGSAERLAQELSAAFTLVPDGGHVLPEQHPDLLAEELSRILEALAAEIGPAVST
jgi:pimeloyl-ACP methyl ester carboxylesterase